MGSNLARRSEVMHENTTNTINSKWIIKITYGAKNRHSNFYGAPPPSTEEHHEVIEDVKTIIQGLWTQTYDIEGLEHANAVLTILNSTVMAQSAQMNLTMNAMKAQLKTLASLKTNESRSNRKFYCWSCRSNFNHGEKPDQQRNQDIKRKRNTRKWWVAV